VADPCRRADTPVRSSSSNRRLSRAIRRPHAIEYYSLRENDAEEQGLQLTIQQLQQTLGLTTNRLKGGLASALGVESAQTVLDHTKAQAQALDVQRSQLEHAIAVLVGRLASEFSLAKSPFDGTSPAIPTRAPGGSAGAKAGYRRRRALHGVWPRKNRMFSQRKRVAGDSCRVVGTSPKYHSFAL